MDAKIKKIQINEYKIHIQVMASGIHHFVVAQRTFAQNVGAVVVCVQQKCSKLKMLQQPWKESDICDVHT